MADYTPTVRKILSENGCRLERQGKGDHEIWYSPLTKLRFPVDGFSLSYINQNKLNYINILKRGRHES